MKFVKAKDIWEQHSAHNLKSVLTFYLSMFNPGSTETFRFTLEGDQLKMEIVAPIGRRPDLPGTPQPEPVNHIFTGTKMKN